MILQRFLIIVFLIGFTLTSRATNTVRINLYNQFELNNVIINPIEGKYQLVTDNGKVYKIKKGTTLRFTSTENTVNVWEQNKQIGTFKQTKLINTSNDGLCKVELSKPKPESRLYNGEFEISSNNHNLNIINSTDIHSYLAGVVEAEAGPNAPYEFYKSQAIISRTYLLSIINKQGPEKYWLGDDVNHQVFKGLSHQNSDIIKAVKHTAGLVIIDTAQTLITATFHSNSGGHTLNSEDVWLSQTSYLKATKDPFSLNQKNTFWKDTIHMEDWIGFLIKSGIKADSTMQFNFTQSERAKYYKINSDTISLRKIREHFKLRSTWFSMAHENNQILIHGRGYGHGVGLSQEGAMEMARQNYSFLDIIHYYYKDVKVINYHLLYKNL